MPEPITYGRIVTRDGELSIALTEEDVLWAARSVAGEILPPGHANAGPTDEADVLWTLTQRFVRWRRLGKSLSFVKSTRSFSQPINPIWASVEGAGCQRDPAACTEARLAKRQALIKATWADLAAHDAAQGTRVVAAAKLWAEGRLRNTVPGATNFAVPAVSAAHMEGTVGAKVVAERGGHWYISDPPATDWPAGYVTVESADGQFVSGEHRKSDVLQAFWDTLTIRSFWRRG